MSDSYGIIGNGHLATHLARYFSLLDIPYTQWHRQMKFTAPQLLDHCSTIIVLVKDEAICHFIPQFPQKIVIHCSGNLSIPNIQSVHPLFSFTQGLYDLNTYCQIPFVLEKDKLPFEQIFPMLSNPHHYIESASKKLYHALCVAGGNINTIIWKEVFHKMQSIGIEPNLLHPYLKQITDNLMANYQTSLAGPIARKDMQTIEDNLASLGDEMLGQLYKVVVNSELEK